MGRKGRDLKLIFPIAIAAGNAVINRLDPRQLPGMLLEACYEGIKIIRMLLETCYEQIKMISR